MGRTVMNSRKKRDRKTESEENGFGDWGGYMAAKKAKLLDQFHTGTIEKVSDIFQGISIHVNGLTKPPADTLKDLMAAHGGEFHMYQCSSTTHIIASNLPNVKIKQLGSVPIVKPSWITESISIGKLLDYRRYLLYTNQSTTQPRIGFPVIEKSSVNKISTSNINHSDVNTIPEVVKNTGESSSVASETPLFPIEKMSIEQISRGSTKTASDPKFLEEFYNNSRLHLISTLGAEFKQLVIQMRDKSNGKFPGREKLILTKGKKTNYVLPNSVIMHIDMDCFFVSVGLRNHPELRGKPVAITHARSGQLSSNNVDRKVNRELEFALVCERFPEVKSSRVDKLDANASMSEIASCSYEARKCGIRNGMFLGQAVKLCPDLKTLPYDFEGYKEVSNCLYKTIASYTLDIEAVSCDEMYVDITSIIRDTGLSVDEWASHIRSEIMGATGCPCSTGFGANRLQARLATRKAKPSGQYYLQADDVEMYMAEIPLSDLPGVGMATLAKLRNLGLNTCGDVQVASLKVLQSELGQKAGETLKLQAMGIDNRPLNFYHERKSVSADVNYGIRFKNLEECYSFLQSLSNEVYNRLRDIGMKAKCVTLKLLVRAADAPVETAKFLGCGVCDSLTKSTSNLIINSPEIIFKEVKALYDKLNPPVVDLRGVGIQLTKLEKNAPINKALTNFLKQAPTKKVKPLIDKNVDATNFEISNKQVIEDDSASKPVQTIKKVEGTKPSVVKQGVVNQKRGRPKGIRNSAANRVKNGEGSSSLNRYFGKNKYTQKHEKSQQAQSKQNMEICEQIDLNVLNELPEELRNEIIKEYQLDYTLKHSASSSSCKTKKDTVKPLKIEEESEKAALKNDNSGDGGNTDNAKRSPFSGLTWDQIKPIIKKWIQSADKPSEVDVEMIAEHFKQLAIDREIEILKIIFNFLHRTFSNLNCYWHSAYFSIVNIMQQGMVARYGGTLMVQRKFDCCRM